MSTITAPEVDSEEQTEELDICHLMCSACFPGYLENVGGPFVTVCGVVYGESVGLAKDDDQGCVVCIDLWPGHAVSHLPPNGS